jgi:hypothetical protein
MLKRLTLSTCILLGLSSMSVVQAAPILMLTPADGNVAGTPGSIVGWGFDLHSDPTNALTIISSFLTNQTNASLGSYGDIMAGQGGPDAGLVDPGATDWVQPFFFTANPANQTGVGWFQISSLANFGDIDSGMIQVDWELDSVSAGCPGCFVSSGALLVPFQVTVGSSAVPEPGTGGLFLLSGLLGLALARRVSRP